MADKHEIEIIIDADGRVRLDVKGIKGPACAPVVRRLTEGLGKLETDAPTTEFYEKPTQQQSQRQS